jgi:hypothetical protein
VYLSTKSSESGGASLELMSPLMTDGDFGLLTNS